MNKLQTLRRRVQIQGLRRYRKLHSENGSFLVAAIIIIMFLTAIALSLSGLIAEQYGHTKYNLYAANATQAAEAGIEESVHALNNDDNFAGYSSPQQLFDNPDQGKGVFTTVVSENPDGKSKSIISTGEVYRNDSATTPYITREVKVNVVGTSSGGYSVFTGPGGLNLSGGAHIINSSVFVNGYINLTGGAQIGQSDHPLDVDVANYQCPAGGGATYPSLCTNGTQPISVTWGTYIYGNVCATGQTNTGPANNITGGNGGTGLKPGCIAPQASMPTYNRQAQIDNVTTTGSYSDNQYNCSQWNSSHGSDGYTVSWPSELELSGNVTLSSACKLTITGDVYITGNLTLTGGAEIKVADSVGGTRPVVIVDGTITVKGGASIDENTSGTSAEFISYENSTGDPSATLSGQQLYESQQTQIISLLGGAQVPGAIFDAYWGKITISGGATVGSAIGQTIDMSGGGTVTFGTSLASGQRTWTIRSYQRLYN